MRPKLNRIRKAIAAGVATLVAELTAVLLAGGALDENTVPAAVALAIAAGWAAYRTRNKLGVNELRAQLAEAMEARRP